MNRPCNRLSTRINPGRIGSPIQGTSSPCCRVQGDVNLEQREYAVEIKATEYLLRMESSLVGRRICHTIGPGRWNEFRCAAERRFAAQFPSRFTILPRANLAVATK